MYSHEPKLYLGEQVYTIFIIFRLAFDFPRTPFVSLEERRPRLDAYISSEATTNCLASSYHVCMDDNLLDHMRRAIYEEVHTVLQIVIEVYRNHGHLSHLRQQRAYSQHLRLHLR